MMLASKNAHVRDAYISFDSVYHTYTVKLNEEKQIVTSSVTSFCSEYFSQFNADRIVDTYFEKWSTDINSKYFDMIQSCKDDEEAKAVIKASWLHASQDARALGTRMHEQAEAMMNGVGSAHTNEMRMLQEWRICFEPQKHWQPHRTEWPIWWEGEDDRVLVAGTVDLLMKSTSTEEYALVDFKRTNPRRKNNCAEPNLIGPCKNTRFHPGHARPPLSQVEDNDFGKYTVQLNVYAKMLRDKYDIDVDGNMFLLQLHEDMTKAHCVKVQNLKATIDTLFEVEAQRRPALRRKTSD